MDFSNVGMGAFDESSAQARFQSKARGMDYAQAPIDQHRCFVSGMCYHSDGGHDDKGHRELSYQPNGIGDGGTIKTSPGPLISAPTPTSGGFGELIDPQGGFASVPANVLPPTPKREKYSTGTSESHSSAVGGQMTFQELTAIRSEPMDYAPEGQSSQV
ncbi:unnamed protein product [Mesocestoides corti]|uniref:Uncharacterized protein n=1 Tax=Mesocestoides corti TaxID=53468 RepID=A0A0R3UH14_MESCO|nr:unnamed protein product [Mesocestoides corti]